MMRRTLYVLLLCLLPVFSQAQDRELIIKKSIDVDLLDSRARVNPVPDSSGKSTAWLVITFPAVDSLTFDGNFGQPEHSPGKWVLFIPEGKRKIEIAAPGYRALTVTFPMQLLPNFVYNMERDIRVINPLRTFILPSFSLNQSQFSYGLMLGFCKDNGGYLRAKSDFHFNHLNPSLSCDASGNIGSEPAWYTESQQKARLAFTGGYLRRIYKDNLYAYIGGGYGIRTLAWEMIKDNDHTEYVKVAPYSFRGVELETGLVLRLSYFSLSLGVQTNADRFKYWEANLGIGVAF